MKIVVIMCVEEFNDRARKLLKDHNISVFSEIDTLGYHLIKNDNIDNWFADKNSPDNSHMLFTICDDNKAEELMKSIAECKTESKNDHVHAFQLNVEKFIN